MNLIYVASAYYDTNPRIRQARFETISNIVAEAHHLDPTNIYYSPIVYYHPLAIKRDLPKDFSYWQKVNHYVIMLAEMVCFFDNPDLVNSQGCRDERDFCKAAGKLFRFFTNAEELVAVARREASSEALRKLANRLS